jgi:hypothetical protein
MTVEQASNLILALAAVSGLCLTAFQLREGRRAQEKAFARQMWGDYLKLGLSHPELGDSQTAEYELKDVKGYDQLALGETLGAMRYHWFVTIVLDTCNAVLKAPGEDWRPTIKDQLKGHVPFLQRVWRKAPPNQDPWGDFYDPRLREIVDKLISEAPRSPPVPGL